MTLGKRVDNKARTGGGPTVDEMVTRRSGALSRDAVNQAAEQDSDEPGFFVSSSAIP